MQRCANIFKLCFLDFSSTMCGLLLQFGYTKGSDCFFVVFRGCSVVICGRFLLSQDSAFLQYTCYLTSGVTFAFFFFLSI